MIKALIRQFFKYGLVGLLNTAVTISIIFILSNLLHVHYMTANALGYMAGFINSFLWNRNWTFKESRGFWHHQLIKFIVVFGICYLIQLGFLFILVQFLMIQENISQVIAMILYTGISFIINKVFVFTQQEESIE